jgi:hypothetical protein
MNGNLMKNDQNIINSRYNTMHKNQRGEKQELGTFNVIYPAPDAHSVILI